MTAEACEHFRGLIAMDVVGQISVDERVALTAHTDGCLSCREERGDLGVLSGVLPAADPDRFDEHELPFRLQTAVLDRLREEERHERRTRRARVAVTSAAAAALAAVVLVLALLLSAGNGTRTVALEGPSHVHATARLTPESWGTSVELRESGQRPNQVLSVSMHTVSGSWWQIGTYRTVGGAVHVTMPCVLKMSKIAGVAVRDRHGHVVLYGDLGGHDGRHRRGSLT
jgi:hypothetical protein